MGLVMPTHMQVDARPALAATLAVGSALALLQG